ncbi:MAG: PAS domain S-box protein [Deltaproteobacteria bacterium]|nr:PAS domain S-box protein [Deltaproteobacteria bacterium]
MKSPFDRSAPLEVNASRICGLSASGLGLAALWGWVADIPLLQTFGSGLIPMAPSTAVLFFLYGIGTAFLDRAGRDRRLYRVEIIVGSTGALFSLLLYLLSSFNIQIEAEHLGLSITGVVNGSPVGHMSPLTAFCFLLTGFSFLMALASTSERRWPAAASLGFAFFVAITGTTLLTAYLLGSPFLYGSGIIPPALPTSLAFLMLGISLGVISGKQIWTNPWSFNPGRTRAENVLILIFLGLTLGIISSGYWYFRTSEQHYRAEVDRQISAVSDLKVWELVQWRKERQGDASLLHDNPNFSLLFGRFMDNPKDPSLQKRLRTWLDKFQRAHGYDRVFLLDARGVERLGMPETPSFTERHLLQHLPEVFRSGQVTFLDFHREDDRQPIHLSLLVPLFEQPKKTPLGMVVLRINPESYLYPLINRWPGPSRTAETLLVRREGDEVLFLNELRFQKNTALRLRRPLSDTRLPAARAVLGQKGLFEGIDYRGVPVIACLRPVPDSPWFLVSRMDKAEIFAPLRAKLWETALLISVLLFAAGTGLGLIWRHQRLLYYRERLQAAETLKESENRYRNTLDSMMEGCQIIGFDWRYLYLNEAAARSGRQARETLLGRTMMECYPGIESTEMFAVLQRCLAEGSAHYMENEFIYPDGERGVFELSIQPVPEGLSILSIDITEHKKAEEREKHLLAVLDAVRKVNQLIIREKDGALLIREACDIVTSARGFNSAWIGLVDESGKFFRTAESGLGGRSLVLTELERQEEWPSCIRESLSHKDIFVFEYETSSCRECPLEECHAGLGIWVIRIEYRRKTYGLMLVSLPRDLIADQEEQDLFKEMAGDIAFALNVLDQEGIRSAAEAALQKSEEKLKALFENAPDAIYQYDLEGKFLDGNRTAEDLSGYKKEELIGKNFLEIGLLPMEDLEKTSQLLLKSRQGFPTGPDQLTLIRKDGKRVIIETRTFPLKIGNEIVILAIARDLSDRIKLENQILQSQKLEAIGRLTAGVAHDFNNLLTTIIGNAYISLMEVDKRGNLYESLMRIKEAGDRAAGLIRQLLAFSRKQVFQAEVVDLNEVVTGLKDFLARLIGEDITLETHLSSDLGRIEADIGQLEQVLVNLSVNSRDAMPRGGLLTIETANAELDEEYAAVHVGVIPGHYVTLTISDTGIGMPPEIQSQIFEPFFTTKEKDKGTGLGLSTVYGIIKQSKGNIWVYSEPGKGATFKIYLPRVDKQLIAKSPSQPQPKPLGGSETILLVEDDERLKKTASLILERYGYRVLPAGNEQEALSVLQSNPEGIDLLLTDVVMPGLGGKDLAERVKTIQPGIKVLYMSGYTDNTIVHHGYLDQGIDFIEKPFTPEALALKVRTVLDRIRTGPEKISEVE